MSSFRLELEMEKRNGSPSVPHWINHIEKEVLDDMLFDFPRLYVSQRALLYSVQPVRLSDTFMSFPVLKIGPKSFDYSFACMDYSYR